MTSFHCHYTEESPLRQAMQINISLNCLVKNLNVDWKNNKMEKRKLVIPNDIKAALKAVGVKKGQAIMVHTSLGSLGYVCGGAQSVIEALLECVGEEEVV